MKSLTTFRCFLLLFVALLLLDSSAQAVWIGGFYETEVASKKITNENNRWELQTPRHNVQLKMYADPFKGTSLYTQFSASSNDFTAQKKRFFLDRAWASYWTPKAEAIIMKRDERHFIDSPLLRLVDQDVGSYNRDDTALRLNVFDFHRLRASFIFTAEDPTYKSLSPQVGEWYGFFYDQSGQSFVGKANYRAIDDKRSRTVVDFGASYIRKDWQMDKFAVQSDPVTGNKTLVTPAQSIRPKNEVAGADFRLGFRGISWNTEVAVSTSVDFGSVQSEGERTAWVTEVRDIRLGNLLLQGRYFDYGKNFRDELSRKFSGRQVRTNGGSEFGRRGYFGEVNFFAPTKLVQLTVRRSEYRSLVDSAENNPALREDYIVHYSTAEQKITDEFGEVFVQFVRGIQMRFNGSHFRNKTGDFWTSGIELRGENETGFGRIQVRLRDIGSEVGLGERLILNGEFRVNLTQRLQALVRLVNVQSNYTKQNWWNGFWQLRYFIGSDMEMYFEYGEGNDNIADNSSYRPTDQVKALFRVNF